MQGEDVLVKIEGAEAGKAQVPATPDLVQSWTNGVQLHASWIIGVWVFLAAARKRQILKGLQEGLTYAEFARQALIMLAPIGGIVLNIGRFFLIQTSSLAIADSFKLASIFIVIACGLPLGLRAVEQARLTRDLFEGKMQDSQTYSNRVRAGWWPWAIGLSAAIVCVVLVFFFMPNTDGDQVTPIQTLALIAD